MRIWTISVAVGSFSKEMKWAVFENLSITERLTLLPAGRLVTESKKMWDQGWFCVEKGCRKLDGYLVEGLMWAQMEQAVTKSFKSFSREPHQKCIFSGIVVLLMLRRQAKLAVWAQWVTANRAAEGTNHRLSQCLDQVPPEVPVWWPPQLPIWGSLSC